MGAAAANIDLHFRRSHSGRLPHVAVGRKGTWGTPSLKLGLRQVRTERLVATQLLHARVLRSCALPSQEMDAFGRTLQECNLWVKWLKLGPMGLFY